MSYPAMAPLTSYLEPNVSDEVALARSAAPAAVSAKAEVLTLGNHGYTTAVKGDNGFVCVVERSWAVAFAHPEFWNPKFRAPTCYNHAAALTVLPRYLERTVWVLSRVPISEMKARTLSELSTKGFMLPAAGAMAYMMSKQGYLNDAAGHWHPHLMFYLANTEAAAWGANLSGSPILADSAGIFAQEGSPEPVITFFVPVIEWSDGTVANLQAH
jgi:hypothetical protein